MAEIRFEPVAARLALVALRFPGRPGPGPGGEASDSTLGGLRLPTTGRVAVETDREMLWLGPEECLVVSEGHRGDVLERELRASGVAVVDLSANWVAFDLTGARAREVLAAGCSLDLHPRSFRSGDVAQTLVGKVGVILWQRSEEPAYRILVRPSFAAYFTAWIGDVIEGLPDVTRTVSGWTDGIPDRDPG